MSGDFVSSLERVISETSRIADPDGVSLADDRIDRSGFDGLISMPMADHDTIVPTYGYNPIPSARGFTLVAREAGRVIGQISVSVWEHALHLDTIVVADDRRGAGVSLALQDAFMRVFDLAAGASPEAARAAPCEVWGDFNEVGGAFAARMEERIAEVMERAEASRSLER